MIEFNTNDGKFVSDCNMQTAADFSRWYTAKKLNEGKPLGTIVATYREIPFIAAVGLRQRIDRIKSDLKGTE